MDRVLTVNRKLVNHRSIFGRICIIASLIAFTGIFDGLIASYRKPKNDLDLITGRSLELIGKVYGNVSSAGDIGFVSDSQYLFFDFDKDLFSGYWLGEGMWRGHLKADSSLPPGRYNIKIIFNDQSNIKPDDVEKIEKLCTYSVNVYSDARAMRQNDLSFIKRFTAISPWVIAIAFLPIMLLSGGMIFIISGKLDSEMARCGLAEIYRVSRHSEGLEVFFGLGKRHGLEEGEKMKLLDERGGVVSEIVVGNIGNDNSSALINIPRIRPGFFVERFQTGEIICS